MSVCKVIQYLSQDSYYINKMNKFPFRYFCLILLFAFTNQVNSQYWLVIGTYRQGPGSRAEVSGITSPSLFAIPMKFINQFGNLIVNGLVYTVE